VEVQGALPWPHLMALGLGALRLSPAEFWRCTPRELERALAGAFGELEVLAPLTRTVLDDLMHRYPDAGKM